MTLIEIYLLGIPIVMMIIHMTILDAQVKGELPDWLEDHLDNNGYPYIAYFVLSLFWVFLLVRLVSTWIVDIVIMLFKFKISRN